MLLSNCAWLLMLERSSRPRRCCCLASSVTMHKATIMRSQLFRRAKGVHFCLPSHIPSPSLAACPENPSGGERDPLVAPPPCPLLPLAPQGGERQWADANHSRHPEGDVWSPELIPLPATAIVTNSHRRPYGTCACRSTRCHIL